MSAHSFREDARLRFIVEVSKKHLVTAALSDLCYSFEVERVSVGACRLVINAPRCDHPSIVTILNEALL